MKLRTALSLLAGTLAFVATPPAVHAAACPG
jgi:hypothetical protein